MNAGTTKYAIRIPDDLMDEVREAIVARNAASPRAPMSFSDYVRAALVEKLAKGERSRGLQATRRIITKNIRLKLEAE